MNANVDNQLSGSVTRVISRNLESGWAVLDVDEGKSTVTVVGNLSHVDEGLRIEAEGTWFKHPTFGKQFRVDTTRIYPPTGADGIERFLRSGAVDGIGPVFARKIVGKFGDKTLHVIEKERWRLRYLKGVGPKRIKAVVEGVSEYRERMEVMSFLHGRLGPVRAHRVYEKYGDKARDKIAKNPYRLIDDFDGFGFKLADQVARDVGVGLDHELRLDAAVLTTLKNAARQGHTCVDIEACKSSVEQLLGSSDRANSAMSRVGESEEWRVVQREGRDHLELNRFSFLDGRIAERLKVLKANECRVPSIDADLAIPWVEEKIGITFEAGQRNGIATVLSEKVSVITGGPGVGKTTLLNGLLRILGAKKIGFALAAPTGRASKRMSESTGEDAQTIHRLLEYSPKTKGFTRNADSPLECDVLFIDESSMVDISLARAVLEAVPNDGKLVLVGDPDQLPSVGPGQILADIVDSGVVPVAKLTEPFRQASGSSIIGNAHLVNNGQVPDLDGLDGEFEFIETKDAQGSAAAVVEVVSDGLKEQGYDLNSEVLVLSPMNKGAAGVEALNAELQQRVNPTPKDTLVRGARTYSTGDKVIQYRNNRDLVLWNGDIGVISSINRDQKVIQMLFDGRMIDYPFANLFDVGLANVMTVHRAQGCETAVVVMVLDMSNSVMLGRKVLYTGITRAKKKVIIVGQRRAMHIAVSEARAHARVTRLKDRLREVG